MTREERNRKLARATALLNTARAEGRDMTAAESGECDRLLSEVEVSDMRSGGNHIETRGVSRDERTADDVAFTRYLRTGDTSGLQTRADGTGFSTAPNSAGLNAGSNGDFAGYLIPQGFWEQLAVALKAYGGVASDPNPRIER